METCKLNPKFRISEYFLVTNGASRIVISRGTTPHTSAQRQKGNGRVQDREECPETEGEWESAGPGGVPRHTTTIIVL